MREHTTSETLELTKTTYSCEVEGCGFTTENRREAERHPGEEHSVAATDFVADETLYRFDSRETFDAYAEANDIPDRRRDWHGPGWYRTFWKEDREPCGCCYDSYEHLQPARWIAYDWQRKIRRYKELLGELAEFLEDDELLDGGDE